MASGQPHAGPPAPFEPHGDGTGPPRQSIPLTDAEIRAGFYFFTGGSDVLTPDMLYKFTDILMPTVPRKTLRDALIVNGGTDIKLADVIKILREEHSAGLFDPVAAAFAAMDPLNQGFVNEDFVQNLLAKSGVGEVSPEDIHMLLTLRDIDFDSDQMVGLEDFRKMFPSNVPSPKYPMEPSGKGGQAAAGPSRRAAARSKR